MRKLLSPAQRRKMIANLSDALTRYLDAVNEYGNLTYRHTDDIDEAYDQHQAYRDGLADALDLGSRYLRAKTVEANRWTRDLDKKIAEARREKEAERAAEAAALHIAS